jgi:hypothetical protein
MESPPRLESLLIFSYICRVNYPAAGGIDFLWRKKLADSLHISDPAVFDHHTRNCARMDGLEVGRSYGSRYGKAYAESHPSH